jgi:hypothetical protein
MAPATLIVNTTGDGFDPAHLSLRQAIVAVDNQSTASLTPAQRQQVSGPLGSSDQIQFAPGVSGTIALTQNDLVISRSVVITGPGAANLRIDAQKQSRVLDVLNTSSTVEVHGLALVRGKVAGPAGGVFNQGTLTLQDCAVSGNAATLGGGVFNAGVLRVLRTTFEQNRALNPGVPGGGAGAGIYSNGTLTVLARPTTSGSSAAGWTRTARST